MKNLLILLALFSAPSFAGVAFYKGERVSGMNRICYYDYLGSTVAITISAASVCPATIEI